MALGAIAAVLALGAASAQAAQLSASYSGGTLTYTAAPGENNDLAVTDMLGAYEVNDWNHSQIDLQVLGGGSCTLMELWKYKCVSVGLSHLAVNLGDGTDTLDLSRTAVPSTVTAGSGNKTITGGSGADAIDALNGSVDHISCGAGVDTVQADDDDVVAADCEQVSVNGAAPVPGTAPVTTGWSGSQGGSGAGGSQGGSTSLLQEPVGLLLPANPVALSSRRLALVTVGCAVTAADDCRGDIYLELPRVARRGHATQRLTLARGHYISQQRRIAHRKFSVPRGKTRKIAVRVAFRGHYAQVVRRRRLRASMRIIERDRSGNIVGQATCAVTLHAASNKWSRRRPNHRSRVRR